jgi:hypothetical protein
MCQNITLIVLGVHLASDFSAKMLLGEMICSTESETCSFTQHESCHGSDVVCNLLSAMENLEFGDEFTYSIGRRMNSDLVRWSSCKRNYCAEKVSGVLIQRLLCLCTRKH